jgi:Ca-activated chloride channel family protein
MNLLHKTSFTDLLHNGLRFVRRMPLSLLLVVAGSAAATAQVSPNGLMQQGNKLYEQKKYDEAAANYAKALQKNPTYTPGLFNLGNTLYQQKKFDESRKVMEQTAKVAADKDGKSAANYNVGNTYMSQQKWEDAVTSYKQALRNNPQDADAKYNLSYAEQMLKKQNQNNKNNKNNKQKQNKDQQKDKQNQKQDQNKDKQDKQDNGQNDKDQKQDQKQDQQPEGQPSKLSQQQADQLLNALQQEEKKLQDKMKKEKGAPIKLQKDW